ncbi:MAG: type II toxin-antitoxin system Phd/YefM family antitoxin [Chloroflexota bacterium]|nr:type II toxin-antitoxin system Phd/YefM family antitoxin [Chloroflexota bacterium]MDE2885775.1 type II toxin-antitoxin system Phd/YefM family antitoxin [Chloroflexota bacterium]
MAANEIPAVGGVRTIKASEFKAKCLKLMDEVAESGQEIVVTKNGRPVSRIVPYHEKRKLVFGEMQGLIKTYADIVEPMPAEWFEKDGSDDDLF